MTDHTTPNLPSRGLDASAAFYEALGFVTGFKDDGWMILKRGDLILEFFPDPDLDPLTSAASCCLRLDELDAFYETCKAAGHIESCFGHPRLHAPAIESSGLRIGALIDLDGNLLRLIQN